MFILNLWPVYAINFYFYMRIQSQIHVLLFIVIVSFKYVVSLSGGIIILYYRILINVHSPLLVRVTQSRGAFHVMTLTTAMDKHTTSVQFAV